MVSRVSTQSDDAARKKARRDYMRAYRERPGVRERELREQRQADLFNREANRVRWNAHNQTEERKQARAAWYQANRERILAVQKMRRDYVAKFGKLPEGYRFEDDSMRKSLRTGKDCYAAFRGKVAREIKRKEASDRRAQKDWELWNSYNAKFGELKFFEGDPRLRKTLMQESLATGQDLLADRREDHARRMAAKRDSKPVEKRPFDAEREAALTWLIKKRMLAEGSCDLPWQSYFDFRERNACERLTANDLRYAGQYTSCPLPPRKF